VLDQFAFGSRSRIQKEDTAARNEIEIWISLRDPP
jgi:hypothetical protein